MIIERVVTKVAMDAKAAMSRKRSVIVVSVFVMFLFCSALVHESTKEQTDNEISALSPP